MFIANKLTFTNRHNKRDISRAVIHNDIYLVIAGEADLANVDAFACSVIAFLMDRGGLFSVSGHEQKKVRDDPARLTRHIAVK
jgi:hypothetical protein